MDNKHFLNIWHHSYKTMNMDMNVVISESSPENSTQIVLNISSCHVSRDQQDFHPLKLWYYFK